MTPQDCFTATPEQFAPVLAEIMHWTRHGDCCFREGISPIVLAPFRDLSTAFRVQDRIKERGLEREFGGWLGMVTRAIASDDLHVFTIATATPFDRCRAACAAYLESKESK